ncbi:MAG: AAA family ATPase, partial [Candidatus Lokiarchaeota archaeon]|nr:AAA family ATPase [Candidatus Lokiarchaeota archaeon]
AITGTAGVGKTAVARYCGKHIENAAKKKGIAIKFILYNAHTFRTKTSILRNLLTDHFNVTARGFSDEEILGMLVKRLEKDDMRLIITLDEANLLGSDEILSIIHASEVFGIGRSRISTIIICRRTEWRAILNAPLSGHIHDQINIPGYTRDELVDILTYRAQLAFNPGVISEEIIEMVAEIASQTQNARHGIEILLRAGKMADYEHNSEINAENVRRAKVGVYPELRPDVLDDLNDHELLTALGLARRLKHHGITATTINEAYKYYQIACEEKGFKAQSMSAFRKYVSHLDSVGIIGKAVGPLGRGRRGRRARITLYDLPATVLEERVLKILELHIKK